jgi:hypothetical protein
MMVWMSKPLFREQLRDYVSTERKVDFDAMNPCQQSKEMARFFAEKIVQPVNPGLVPSVEEDLFAAVIDGSDDCGVDFLWHEAGTVLLIQAKYSGQKKASKRPAENPDHFESFCSVLARLYAGPKAYKMNSRLREGIADINWETANFQLYYITLRQPAQNSFARERSGIQPLPELPDLSERTTVELLDEERLNIRLRDALSLVEDIGKPVSIRFSPDAAGHPWLRFGDPTTNRTSYVGRINGSQVAEIFKAHKSRLFALNIRNYIGDNLTNREIKKTAVADSRNFFFYNNGVSALATRIEPDLQDKEQRTLKCEQFSIINGAQTVRSLFKAQAEDSSSVHQVELLLRISEFRAKRTQAEQDFLDNTTRYNNTQNAIKISDFRSNDRIQVDLKAKFENLPARKGRRFVYKNKRSGEKEGNRIAVGMEEFTKTAFAFLFGPDDVYGGSQYIFDTSKAGGYVKLFGRDGEIQPALSNDQFRVYAGVWFICEYVKDLWRNESEARPAEALERRWMVYYGVGESFRVVYSRLQKELDPSLRKMCDPSWYTEPDDNPIKAVLRRHSNLVFTSLKNAYAQASNEADFRHRNWFRLESTLKSVRSQLENLWPIISDTADKYVI